MLLLYIKYTCILIMQLSIFTLNIKYLYYYTRNNIYTINIAKYMHIIYNTPILLYIYRHKNWQFTVEYDHRVSLVL